MPACNQCDTKWSWTQTLKRSSFTFGIGMICPYCKQKQYISASSRKKHTMYVLATFVPFLINLFFDLSISKAIFYAFITGVIIIGIYPFLIELSNQEESLF